MHPRTKIFLSLGFLALLPVVLALIIGGSWLINRGPGHRIDVHTSYDHGGHGGGFATNIRWIPGYPRWKGQVFEDNSVIDGMKTHSRIEVLSFSKGSGIYRVQVDFSYSDGSGERKSFSRQVDVPLGGPPTTVKPRPDTEIRIEITPLP